MTAALAIADRSFVRAPLDPSDHVPRLGRLIAGVWEALGARSAVECPVCAGHMEPEYGAGARPIGGRCADCGAVLS